MKKLYSVVAYLFVCNLFIAPPVVGQTEYTWGGSSGDWDVATNWSPNGVPGAADYVTVDGGTVSMVSDTEVARLSIENLAIVRGAFDLTVTDSLIWSGGGTGWETFADSGNVVVAASATMRLIGPTTAYEVGPNRTVVNSGVTVWDGPGIWRGQGKFVNNGELILSMGSTGAFGFVFSSLVDAFTNSSTGTMRRIGEGEIKYQAGLINDGAIIVEDGTFDLGGFNSTGTSGSGNVEVLTGAKFKVTGGNHVLTGDPGITGAGILEMTGGSLTLDGAYQLPVTRFTAFSRLILNGTGQTDSLDLAGGGELNGSGTMTVTTDVSWGGGSMGGSGTTTLGPNVPLVIDGANVGVKDTRTLRVEGTTTWSGEADFSNGNGATFQNAGTLLSTGAGERTFSFGTFDNLGTLVHDTGSLTFFAGMSNTGLVSVESGTLRQQGNNSIGGTDSGDYTISVAGRLEFSGGNRTLTDSVKVGGNGTVVFGGSNLTNNATWQPEPTPAAGVGVLTIDSNYPVAGVLEVEIGGTTAGTDYDQFNVTGSATLGGTLRISLVNSFTPADGDRFLIIPAASGATGQFDDLTIPDGLDAYIDVSAIGAELVIGIPVANESGPDLPKAFALHNAYPNPFNPQATIGFDVPQSGRVQIVMFDALGRQVAVLENADKVAGRYTADIDGSRLPSGLYLVRMTGAAGFAQTKQVVLLK